MNSKDFKDMTPGEIDEYLQQLYSSGPSELRKKMAEYIAGNPNSKINQNVNIIVNEDDQEITEETGDMQISLFEETVSVNPHIPDKQIIANTKLSNAIVPNMLINAGKFALNVAGRNQPEINTVCVLEYQGEDLSITGRKAFTEYDRNVSDAITSLYVNDDNNRIITPASIYRTMVHAKNSETPGPEQLQAVQESVEKMRWTKVSIDMTEELRKTKATIDDLPIENGVIDAPLLNITQMKVVAGGNEVIAYQINDTPILYNYALATNHILTLDASLLDIRDEYGNKLPNNKRRIAIKGYLLRRIQVMKGKTAQSKRILFQTLYDTISEESDNETKELSQPSKHQKLYIRNYIEDVLNYWERKGYIKGHTAAKDGRTFIGVDIKL